MNSNLLTTVKNSDARAMHMLPWRLQENDMCTDLMSHSGKHILTFWGNDDRMKLNTNWCTEKQRKNHAAYVEHAVNNFPAMQKMIEEIYNMEDMPEEAIKAIESLMSKTYFEGVPATMAKVK